MRRVAALIVVVAAFAGCLQAGQLGGSGPAAGDGPVAYALEGCALVEAVVPGDLQATRAALPAGYLPVDYGEYWGGPATGDSAISAVVLDCDRYEGDTTRRDHAEVLFGAYVTFPVEHRDPDAGSFYVLDAASTTGAHRSAVAAASWPATVADRAEASQGAGGAVEARAAGPGWWAEIGGSFPAGDATTGTFAFVNHHVADDGLAVQRLGFDSFPYRTAPVELSVHGVDPVVDLVGEGTVEGVGYHGRSVDLSATVTFDATAR